MVTNRNNPKVRQAKVSFNEINNSITDYLDFFNKKPDEVDFYTENQECLRNKYKNPKPNKTKRQAQSFLCGIDEHKDVVNKKCLKKSTKEDFKAFVFNQIIKNSKNLISKSKRKGGKQVVINVESGE